MGNEFSNNFAIFTKLTIGRASASADARSYTWTKIHHFLGQKLKLGVCFDVKPSEIKMLQKIMFFLRHDNLALLKPKFQNMGVQNSF